MIRNRKTIHNSMQVNESITAYTTHLSNGIRVISEYIPTVASFSLGIWIKAGSRDETKDTAGAVHFLEHLAFRRTLKRSTKALADAFEQMGAYSNAFTTKEHTCYYVRALSADFPKVFSLMAELTLSPALAEKDIEKERNIIIEEIHSCDDEPEEVIFEHGEALLFGNHPLGQPITGTIESVQQISRDALIGLRDSLYNSDSIVIAIAGNIKHDDIVTLTERYFAQISTKQTIRNRDLYISQAVQHKVITKKFQQAHILLAKTTEGFLSDQRYALTVMNMLLGEGMSSRLYQTIRERYGLGYTVYSALDLYSDCGALFLYTACDNKKVEKARDMLLIECEKIINQHPVKSKELERAKAQVKAAVLMSLESMSARMQSLGRGELEEGGHEPYQETIHKINDITLEDIAKMASLYLQKDGWSSVLMLSDQQRT